LRGGDEPHVVEPGDEVKIGFQPDRAALFAPVRAAAKRQAAQLFSIPNTQNDAVPHGIMLRKVQADFGWDWNVALTPFGLDGDFRLEAAGAPRIDAVQVHQGHAPGRVRLTVTLTTENAESAEARARLGAVEAIGLCSIELVTEPDDAGASFKLRVNGRDVFAKGANRIMADALSGRVEEAKTRALPHSAADVHMNIIRAWGGGLRTGLVL